MKVYHDTSVLVAGLVEAHPSHPVALKALGAKPGATSTHALAETWSTLTRLPLGTPVSPLLAMEQMRRLETRLAVVALGVRDYRAAIERCSTRGFRSGAVFDALHVQAALRWGADLLLTFNRADFDRLVSESDPLRIDAPA